MTSAFARHLTRPINSDREQTEALRPLNDHFLQSALRASRELLNVFKEINRFVDVPFSTGKFHIGSSLIQAMSPIAGRTAFERMRKKPHLIQVLRLGYLLFQLSDCFVHRFHERYQECGECHIITLKHFPKFRQIQQLRIIG